MSELEALYRVQELDTRIFELRAREENHLLKGELEELEEGERAVCEELDAATLSLEESKDRQARMESEVQRMDEKLRREEDKLYGGRVTNQKELRGLQAEVRSLKRQKDASETEVLEEMERLDDISIRVEELESRREKLRADMEEKKKILDDDTARIMEELDKLEREKKELRSTIGEELLDLYERLLKSKNSLAVVKVIDGVCQGCRVELPGKEYDRFLKTDAVFRCTNCGRILFK